jgi:hypothetical protein
MRYDDVKVWIYPIRWLMSYGIVEVCRNIIVSMILTSECLVSTVPAKHAERSQC